MIFAVLPGKRSVLLHEREGILCCFARKAIGRRHKSTTLSWCCAADFCGNTIGDSAGDEVSNGLTIVSVTWKSSSSRFAIYEGNMNTQSPYVDANNSYRVTRSFNEYTLSASPRFLNHTSNYVQEPIQSNLDRKSVV